jgi:heme/copper-type cytochrome/quinol oxidase subunit 3
MVFATAVAVLHSDAMNPPTFDPRKDIGATNVGLGMSLFITVEVLLSGAVLISCVMARASAQEWQSHLLSSTLAAVNTLVVGAATAAVWRARASGFEQAKRWLAGSAFLAFLFTVLTLAEYRWEAIVGLGPTASPFLATYVTVTGVHLLHVIGGGVASARVVTSAAAGKLELADARMRTLSIYWSVVAAAWLVIVLMFHLG